MWAILMIRVLRIALQEGKSAEEKQIGSAEHFQDSSDEQ